MEKVEKRTNINLTLEQHKWLTIKSITTGKSMSEIIRGLIDEAMAAEPKSEGEWTLTNLLGRMQRSTYADLSEALRRAAANGQLDAIIKFISPSRGEGEKE